jgi:hypothetical protein
MRTVARQAQRWRLLELLQVEEVAEELLPHGAGFFGVKLARMHVALAYDCHKLLSV